MTTRDHRPARLPQHVPASAEATQATAVEQARAVAEVAAAVRVAQEVPRDVRRAFADMQAACERPGLAERAFYSVRNRGTGPTVHLARQLAAVWGNIDYGVHELRRDDAAGMSEVRAYAWDQQTNVRSSRTFQVPHRRMGGGGPLTDPTDIYLNNQNVGARAVRECILSVLPADFVDEAKAVARRTLENGGGVPLQDRIDTVVKLFADMGVKLPALERRIGRKRGQWSAVDVADLVTVGRTIRNRETTVVEEFPEPETTPADIDRIPPPQAGQVTLPREPAAAENRAAAGPDPDEGVDPDGDWPERATPGGGEQS
jgi:hypothetical protein